VAGMLHGCASADEYGDAVLSQVRSLLEERLARLLDAGQSLPAPEDLARSMAAGIPDAGAAPGYPDLLGPFYSSSGVARLLGIPTKQALDDRRRRGTVLAARTADGMWVYPAFQFDPVTRRVRAGLVPVLAALKTAPRWGAALWLRTPHPDLEDRAPEEVAEDAPRRDFVVGLAAGYAQAISA
jgi:hypothetical protein